MIRILLYLALIPWAFWSAKPDILTINSAPFNDGSYGVGFYNSTLNDSSLLTVCIDFTHHVGFNDPFSVNVVNLHDFSGAQHDSFWEAGYLALQLQGLTDITQISAIQRAIWTITTPGTTDSYLLAGNSSSWVLQAQQNYHSVSDSSFTLLLRSGDPGQAQLVIGVPEPSTYAFCGIGLIALIGLRRFK